MGLAWSRWGVIGLGALLLLIELASLAPIVVTPSLRARNDIATWTGNTLVSAIAGLAVFVLCSPASARWFREATVRRREFILRRREYLPQFSPARWLMNAAKSFAGRMLYVLEKLLPTSPRSTEIEVESPDMEATSSATSETFQQGESTSSDELAKTIDNASSPVVDRGNMDEMPALTLARFDAVRESQKYRPGTAFFAAVSVAVPKCRDGASKGLSQSG